MPSWNELLKDLESKPNDQEKGIWLDTVLIDSLESISSLRGGRCVILYGSAFLQKPGSNQTSITHEDINGFMTAVHGAGCGNGLTLVMHTPGGVTIATETIVSYLRSKFSDVEVIIPTFAMSAGAMISLSADKLVMARHSQLGPIDPQMPVNGRFVSALAIIDQFERAKSEITGDILLAHLWAPILSSLGPALLEEAQRAIDYSEQIVSDWLEKYMCNLTANPKDDAKKISRHFSRGSNGHKKKDHGRRIDREEAKSVGVLIDDLEADQNLQEAVLTTYHLMTILFEKSQAQKLIATNKGKMWLKNG